MRAPEWHTTRLAQTPLYGQLLEEGDRIEPVDMYDSSTGQWKPHPCVGSVVSGQPRLATTVRPVDPPVVDTLSAWADVMGDDIEEALRIGPAMSVPQEMLDDGVPLWRRAAGKDLGEAENLGEMEERAVEPLKPLDSFEAFGGTISAMKDPYQAIVDLAATREPFEHEGKAYTLVSATVYDAEGKPLPNVDINVDIGDGERPKAEPVDARDSAALARALDDRHRPKSAIGGVRLIDHKWPPMAENHGEMEERKVEPLKDVSGPTPKPWADRTDVTEEDIEEARRIGTGPAMEPPDEVA